MVTSFSIRMSFSSDFDKCDCDWDDHKLRNKQVNRVAMKQEHHKLAKVKKRAYAANLDDIIFDSDNDDDASCSNKDEAYLDVMGRVELKVKDGLQTDDLVPELLKVSKDELINIMLHLVSRVCACDKKNGLFRLVPLQLSQVRICYNNSPN